LDYLPYGEQIAGDTFTTHKFTGKERDSETGNDYFGARYYSSSIARFLSPDPSGGHFMNPQSLNRYAYVHDNPLSMVDPFGLDCVYPQNLKDERTVSVESGDCSQDNGIYVNGTVDLNSFNVTQSGNGDLSLSFGYTSYDTGGYSLYQTNLPEMSSFDPWLLEGGFGFGSPQYAAAVLSRTYQNTRAVTNPVNIAAFYGASATIGAPLVAYGPGLLDSLLKYGPQALANLDQLLQTSGSILQQIALDPTNIEFVTDAIQGYTPGAVPATLGGLAGFAASEIQGHWSQISQGAQNTYQQIKGSVPH
jgi:RHS repeat-associated protein